jgi:5,10-methylenetetrahydromethanopterin reductase
VVKFPEVIRASAERELAPMQNGTMQIRVDIRVPVGVPMPEVVEFVKRCEDAGFYGVGIHDHHHSGRDAYTALALAASSTGRICLYPATSNTVTRHPLVLAALANSLEEVAPGRTFLTLAPGFLSVESAGQRRAPLEKLRKDTTTVRRLLAGKTVYSGGTPVRLRNRPERPPPVLLTASGPRLLELAGEVADGAMMLVGLHPDSVAAARERLAAGANQSGREPGKLREIFIVPVAVGAREEVREWPRRWFREGQRWLEYPSRSNLRWLKEAGIELSEGLDPKTISDDLADRICDSFGLFGEPEYCAERLMRAREEAGVEHVFLFPAHTFQTGYEMPGAEVEAFRRVIGPSLAG